MDEIKVPIYLITGFLESGKTSFLSFTLQQDYLLSLCYAEKLSQLVFLQFGTDHAETSCVLR